MKKLLLSGILISLLFLSCKKDKETDYASLVQGTWINTQVDNVNVLTDASFVTELRSDHVQIFSNGYQLDENNRTWMQNNNYTYSVTGNIITIDGTNNLGHVFHMEFAIQSVDETTLIYTVSKFTIDNVSYPDSRTYTNKKVTSNLATQFAHTWYGKTTTPGSSDTTYHYWDYFADGSYDYYYRDQTGKWVNKPDNEGVYFLYGNLLATNFTNDILSGGTGKAYECWNINIKADTMFWTGLRANGLTTSYRMVKVSGPPAVR